MRLHELVSRSESLGFDMDALACARFTRTRTRRIPEESTTDLNTHRG